MYHPQVIARNIEAVVAARECRVTLRAEESRFNPAYEPTYHSISEIDEANSVLDDLPDPDTGKLSRPLTLEERKWIANERLLCTLDYQYFAQRYGWIKDFRGDVVRFSPNVAQKIFHSIRAEHDLRGAPIEEIDLKARRLGDSTDKELCICHRVTFYSNVFALVASADPDRSDKMSQMMERIWDHLPWWMMPRKGMWRSAAHGVGLFEFPGQDSEVRMGHGNQFSSSARGSDPNIYHLAEVSEYPEPEEFIEAALLRAVIPSRWTLGFLESTAREIGDWFHKKWKYSKANWANGMSRLRPVFLPWFVGTDLYPAPAWLIDHPVPLDWEIPGYVEKHAERARHYVKNNDLLRTYLGTDWAMSRRQMWFYHVEHEEARGNGILNKFLCEMPGDEVEAFQSRNISVFGQDTIQIYRDNRRELDSSGGWVYGLTGSADEIPARLQPPRSEWDPNHKPIDIHCSWGAGGRSDFTLVPLRYQNMDGEDGKQMGRIYIWEPPQDGETYGQGVDTGDGCGQDRSVLQGLRKANLRRGTPDRQVFEMASDYINSQDLWPFSLAMATLYSPMRQGRRQQMKVAIECKGNGELVQLEMKKRGWANFHQWVRYDSKKIEKGKAHKLGIYTNSWFRPMMMDMLIKWLRDNWIEINSPWFIHEMETLERNWDRQDARAANGEFDDRIMAMGFILWAEYDLEIRSAARQPIGARQDGHMLSRVYDAREEADKPKDPVFYRGRGALLGPGESRGSPLQDWRSGRL